MNWHTKGDDQIQDISTCIKHVFTLPNPTTHGLLGCSTDG